MYRSTWLPEVRIRRPLRRTSYIALVTLTLVLWRLYITENVAHGSLSVHINANKRTEIDHEIFKAVPADEDDRPDKDTHADSNMQPLILSLEKMVPWSADYRFPDPANCDLIRETSDTLPDMVVVPFEEAVKGVDLAGWEDQWVSQACYVGPKLAEPKIDFVYTCM
jgi:hypothetical protein